MNTVRYVSANEFDTIEADCQRKSRHAAYQQAKREKASLEALEKYAGRAWNAIPGCGSGAGGLTPDSIKASPEYRAARLAYDNAFFALRKFNASFNRQFKAEIRQERAARKEMV